jgi:glutaredoxin 3
MNDTNKMSNGRKSVTIYSTPTCHFCLMAKEFFKEKGIEYTDYDVSTDAEKRQEMIEKSGQMGVPVIFMDDEMTIGFDQAKISQLLGI